MFRVSKALLCALASDVAMVSLAARNNVKVSESSAVGHVMDTIGALLQTRGHVDAEVLSNLRVLASQEITPGVSDSMNGALTKVISEIEQKVEAKIKASHADTQAAIDEKIKELTEETTQAVAQKKVADGSDDSWFNCVRGEKATRVAIEEAEKTLTQSRSNTNEPCQLQEDRKMYSWDPEAAALKFDCDISAHGNCDKQMQNYQTQINSMLAGLKSDMGEAAESFAAAKNECDQAKADVVKKQSAHDDSIAAWTAQREECLTKHEARLLSMCLFGEHLQRKCEKVAAYTAQMTEIDAVKGGGYSHPDRVQEWKTTVLTKCMLSKVVAGAQIDTAAMDECENALNFDHDVGVLLRKKTEFSDLTTVDKFTCSEQSIEFRGETWEVPEGEAPSSSEYTTKPFKPEVSLTADSDPFTFCASSAVTSQSQGPELLVADYMSRPTEQRCAIYQDELPGAPLGTGSHSVVMAVEFNDATTAAARRQWILNIGQDGTGAEHWLYNAHAGINRIQFGAWNGHQIGEAEIHSAQTLATTYDGTSKTYSLYVDGNLADTKTVHLDIKSGKMLVGDSQHGNDLDFQGCVRGVDVYRQVLSSEQVALASQRVMKR
jgi:hypothetical protein